MPVDSIITTIITSVMVRIITRSKVGMPKWKGVITPNQAASPTLSKFILPSATAITAPTMMPRSTEMLARKPLAKRAIARIATSTMAEIAMLPKGA